MSDISELSPPPEDEKRAFSAVASTSTAMQQQQQQQQRRAGERRYSVISSSSELTDPEDLDASLRNMSKASSMQLDGDEGDEVQDGEDDEDEDEAEDDDILEVNADGSSTSTTRIRELLASPPKEPKHRWETAYVYAFVERFTNVQKESVYAPQTILEFEQALLSGGSAVAPPSADELWVPSLEPILHDFTERIKRADKANGGTGGMSGKWFMWVPWWIKDQKEKRLPDFSAPGWSKAIATLKDRSEGEERFFTLDWDKQLIVLKALVDWQVCYCSETRETIHEAYKYESPTDIKEKAKQRKEQRAKEEETADATDGKKGASQHAEAATANNEDQKAKDKGKGKETDADKDKEKEKGPKRVSREDYNYLLIKPIGTDAKKHAWFRIDDSPRLYVNSNPHAANQTFVAIADTTEEVQEILGSLKAGPVIVEEKKKRKRKPKEDDEPSAPSTSALAMAPIANDPFSKAKAAAADREKAKRSSALAVPATTTAAKGKGKDTQPKKLKPKEVRENNERKLRVYLSDIVLPSLTNAEDSPYLKRIEAYERRRVNLIKRLEKQARDEAIMAARQAGGGSEGLYPGLRTSRRLRNGSGRNMNSGFGYDEAAQDQALTAAIRKSEKEARRARRRRSGTDGDDSNDSDDDSSDEGSQNGDAGRRRGAVDYGGMDLGDDDEKEEDFELDPEDDSQPKTRRGSLRSKEGIPRGRNTRNSNPDHITSEARGSRSSRAGRAYRRNSREETSDDDENDDGAGSGYEVRPSTSNGFRGSRKAIHTVPADEDEDDDLDEADEPFDGLEEVWSKGKYTGYWTRDRRFIKAKPGDIPLYKLAKLGLPMPTGHDDDDGEEVPAAPRGPAGKARQLEKGNTSVESSVPGSAVPTLELENGETSASEESVRAGGPNQPRVLKRPAPRVADSDEEEDDDGAIVVRSSKSTMAIPSAEGERTGPAKIHDSEDEGEGDDPASRMSPPKKAKLEQGSSNGAEPVQASLHASPSGKSAANGSARPPKVNGTGHIEVLV